MSSISNYPWVPQLLKEPTSPEILSFMDAHVEKDISLFIEEVTFFTVHQSKSMWWRPVHLMVTWKQREERKGWGPNIPFKDLLPGTRLSPNQPHLFKVPSPSSAAGRGPSLWGTSKILTIAEMYPLNITLETKRGHKSKLLTQEIKKKKLNLTQAERKI